MRTRFWIGFGLGLAAWLAINLLVAHLRSDCGLPALFGASACADDIRRAGWPFLFLEQGGFIGLSTFSLPALLADLGVALAAAAALGWVAARWGARRTAAPNS